MRPWTETVPKPLLAVGQKPFLQHQIELLVRRGIIEVVLLVAYLGEQIEAYFGDGKAFGCRISYSYEVSPLGTGGALKNAEGLLGREFLVVNGDTYLDIPYGEFSREFVAGDAAAIIAAYKPDTVNGTLPADKVSCNLAVDVAGKVRLYRKKQPEGLTYVDAGVLGMRKAVLEKMRAGEAFSLEETIFPQLIAEGQMRAWVTQEPFYDMGSPEGLKALVEKLS
jgi:mannose-1-phosphate guanylyltransferase / phosphomannomutase